MDAVVAFIANGEATKPVEPGERALDDPAEHAKALPWDVRRRPKIANNAAGGEAITVWLRSVATVAPGDRLGSIQFFSPAHRADRPAVHHRPALVEPSPSAQLGEEGLMQATPDAGPFPLHQASPARAA